MTDVLKLAYLHWAVALAFWILTILSLWRFSASRRSVLGQIDRRLKVHAIFYLLIYCMMLNIAFFPGRFDRFNILERLVLAVWLLAFSSVPAVSFYGVLRRKGVYRPDMRGGLLSIFLVTHTVMTLIYGFLPITQIDG